MNNEWYERHKKKLENKVTFEEMIGMSCGLAVMTAVCIGAYNAHKLYDEKILPHYELNSNPHYAIKSNGGLPNTNYHGGIRR